MNYAIEQVWGSVILQLIVWSHRRMKVRISSCGANAKICQMDSPTFQLYHTDVASSFLEDMEKIGRTLRMTYGSSIKETGIAEVQCLMHVGVPQPQFSTIARYVFGGYPKNVAELYEIEHDKWKALNPMPGLLSLPGESNSQGLMAVTVGSKIYLFFREQTYEYDPPTDQYTRKADSPIARTWATCAVVRIGTEDRIYIIGGSDPNAIATDANYYYVPSTNKWSAPQARAPYCAYGVTRDNPVWMNMIYYGFGQRTQIDFSKKCTDMTQQVRRG